MVDVFLNLANFPPHAFLTLEPPSGYPLSLKALIKVSKDSWTSQLLYEILRSSPERKFDKTNFISPKSTPPKSPHLLGLRNKNSTLQYFWPNIEIQRFGQKYCSVNKLFRCNNCFLKDILLIQHHHKYLIM